MDETLSDDPRHGSVVLRAFVDADVTTVTSASTDPYIRSLTGLQVDDEASARTYLARQRVRAERGLGFSFAIAEAVSGEAVGQIGLWLRGRAPDGATGYREEAHGRAALGYWIAPDRRGHRYAGDALEAMTKFAFVHRYAERLELFIEPSNVASWRAAERAGYRREGLLRSWQKIDGQRRDMYVYSRLPTDERPAAPA